MWARTARWAPALLCLPCARGSSFRGHKTHPQPIKCDPTPCVPVWSIGCYNVLCSTYAVKWGEREGVGPDGNTNWNVRWPAIRSILENAAWDIICLQEVEHSDANEIITDLGNAYTSHYFKHTKRPPDGLLIAIRSSMFTLSESRELQHNGVAFGCMDLEHVSSGCKVCVVTSHCRGRNKEQLAALAAFADENVDADVTIITGDFNEDFRSDDSLDGVRCPFPSGDSGEYITMQREAGLPPLSRPPHKQAEDQKSGKGKIDWIFVRGRAQQCSVQLFRDEASHRAIIDSHAPCLATGQWPSDHGAEAFSVRVLRKDKA